MEGRGDLGGEGGIRRLGEGRGGELYTSGGRGRGDIRRLVGVGPGGGRFTQLEA